MVLEEVRLPVPAVWVSSKLQEDDCCALVCLYPVIQTVERTSVYCIGNTLEWGPILTINYAYY